MRRTYRDLVTDATAPLEPTIAEDLLLLLFDPRVRRFRNANRLQSPLGAAVLSQLVIEERIAIENEGTWQGAAARAVGDAPTDPVLLQLWERVAHKPEQVLTLLATTGPALWDTVVARLEERGDVVRERKRWLGVFPHDVVLDGGSGRRDSVLEPVRAALVDGVQPTPRTAALAALLSATSSLPAMRRDIPASAQVRRRGKDLEKGDWGGKGVSTAVAEAAVAVAVAAVVSTTVVTGTQ